MKNKYKIFNETYINEEEYENLNLTDEEKSSMKERMNSRINNKKRNHKKKLAVASIPFLIAGSLAMTSETTWAYLKEVGKQIEDFLGRKEEELKGYKVVVNQTSENNGVKMHLNEIMLDDGQLILSIDIDYSNLDTSSLKINENTLMPDIPSVSIGDMIYVGGSGSVYNENSEDSNVETFLIKADLTTIDTDEDGIGDTSNEVLENIEENKNYNIKINFNSLSYETYSNIGNIVGGGASSDASEVSSTEESFNVGEIKGNWEFNTVVNGSNIMNDTEAHKLNKEIKIDKNNIKGTMIIEEVRISPVSAKVKYSFTHEENSKGETGLNIHDEKGNVLGASGSRIGDGNTNYYNFEYELKGNEQKIILKPYIYVNNKQKNIKTENIEINIP